MDLDTECSEILLTESSLSYSRDPTRFKRIDSGFIVLFLQKSEILHQISIERRKSGFLSPARKVGRFSIGFFEILLFVMHQLSRTYCSLLQSL